MNKFYDNKDLSDVQVKCSKTRKIWYCHKVILSISSEMLRSKFTGAMADKDDDIIELNMEEDIIQSTLKYIYGMNTHSLFHSAGLSVNDIIKKYIDVYVLANYWQILILEENIVGFITVTLNNNRDTLDILLRDYLHYDNIYNICKTYIKNNFMRLSDDVLQLINIDLLKSSVGSKVSCENFYMYSKLKQWGKLNKGLHNKKDLDEVIAKVINFNSLLSDEMRLINMKKYIKLQKSLKLSISPPRLPQMLTYPTYDPCVVGTYDTFLGIPNNSISIVLPQTPPRED